MMLGAPCYDYSMMGPKNPILIVKAPLLRFHPLGPVPWLHRGSVSSQRLVRMDGSGLTSVPCLKFP